MSYQWSPESCQDRGPTENNVRVPVQSHQECGPNENNVCVPVESEEVSPDLSCQEHQSSENFNPEVGRDIRYNMDNDLHSDAETLHDKLSECLRTMAADRDVGSTKKLLDILAQGMT